MKNLYFIPNNGYTEIATFDNINLAYELIEKIENKTNYEFNFHNLMYTEEDEIGKALYVYTDNGGNVNVLIENQDVELFKKLMNI